MATITEVKPSETKPEGWLSNDEICATRAT